MSGSIARRKVLASSAACTLGLLASEALAQLRVDVGRGSIEPLPIAIPTFASADPGSGDLAVRVADLVRSNLSSSGLFVLIDGPSAPVPAGLAAGDPAYEDWRRLGTQALVTGLVSGVGGGAVEIEFRLWDVVAEVQLTGFRYSTVEAQWRRVAHKISDAVYTRLTGETGYFDTRIAYVAESGPLTRRVKRIALMDQDGANHGVITNGTELVLTPRFSPDTRTLAYLAFRGAYPRVFLRDLAAGRESLVGGFETMTFSPRFSPDGRLLLLTVINGDNADLFAYDMGTRQARRVTDGAAIDTSPSFSPDGGQIVFNSDRGGSPQLYIVPTSGGSARRISFGEGRYGEPAWSPTGEFIAFSKLLRGFFHIGVIRPDGSDERLITRSFLDETPSWSPNGRVIIFGRETTQSRRRRLFRIDVTGYNEVEVVTPEDASQPDWSALLP